jgi:hypothetical protein
MAVTFLEHHARPSGEATGCNPVQVGSTPTRILGERDLLVPKIGYDPTNLRHQRWDLVDDHLPGERQVDSEVLVNENVAGSGDLAPRHLRIPVSELLREPLHHFADDL